MALRPTLEVDRFPIMDLWRWVGLLVALGVGMLLSLLYAPRMLRRGLADNSGGRAALAKFLLFSVFGTAAAFLTTSLLSILTVQPFEDAHWVPVNAFLSSVWLAVATCVTCCLYCRFDDDCGKNSKKGKVVRLSAFVSSLGLLIAFIGLRLALSTS
jgi:hypothetical protein